MNHISVRLAWHNDGWNGKICKDPSSNVYCVGQHSYPAQKISMKRNLDFEKKICGKAPSCREEIPPCCLSMNAFGSNPVEAYEDPPDWFKDETQRTFWSMPPSTCAAWPYEEMYRQEAKNAKGKWDSALRRQLVEEYFKEIKPNRSLVFYYSNYSNPFSENEVKKYVIVGLSRLKEIGDQVYFEGCSKYSRDYYGGFVWQRNITSHYPDQGFRIPYHKYRGKPDIIDRIALFPDNPRLFKFASRQMSDDDALGLVEASLNTIKGLQEVGDESENWDYHSLWLESLIAELWNARGPIPGMAAVLSYLQAPRMVEFFKTLSQQDKIWEAHDVIFNFMDGVIDTIDGLSVDKNTLEKMRRQWRLQGPEKQKLLKDILPRFDLDMEQIKKILSEKRLENGLFSPLTSFIENPYLLSEQYFGDAPDDLITWGTIDRGMIPSPQFAPKEPLSLDDPRRFRSILITSLRSETQHTFLPSQFLIEILNKRLLILPEWKRFEFAENYIVADEEFLSEALHIYDAEDKRHIALKEVYEDERFIEKTLRFLLGGADIQLTHPVTEHTWSDYLRDSDSPLALKAPDFYEKAIKDQVNACQRAFLKPLSLICGEAGTGKTTVIRAIFKAIKKGHGVGSSIVALAPTGKAADRIRGMLELDQGVSGKVEVYTIHSFLAKRKWLNPNMTLRRVGGEVEAGYQTYVLDECSMMDLALFATLLRSINWSSVRQLILVGDPNQLPPIGRGRVFADIIDHLKKTSPENVLELMHNLRQTLGSITGGGQAIIDLAKLYLTTEQPDAKDQEAKYQFEAILEKIQQGGEVDHDLRIAYWTNQEDLEYQLIAQMESDMKFDISLRTAKGKTDLVDSHKPWRLFHEAFNGNPDYLQIISPYRAEFFGTDHVNRILQTRLQKDNLGKIGNKGGITLFDKVIQIVNRPKSRSIMAFNFNGWKEEPVEIFNGQLGFVRIHGFDKLEAKKSSFSLKRFQVIFSGKDHLAVGYGTEPSKGVKEEKVEENIELAYAISVHKAQGSDFDRVYVIVPKGNKALLSKELFYTALTRARKHCTLFLQDDISVLLGMRRPESSILKRINSSLFSFRSVPQELRHLRGWFEDGRIHQALTGDLVRSKSEVIIANIFHSQDIPFKYEMPLRASDGSAYLPDFTITWRGVDYYWEHLGLLNDDAYSQHWIKKQNWYDRNFPGKLIVSKESGNLSGDVESIIRKTFV